jgi:hypothetical protein
MCGWQLFFTMPVMMFKQFTKRSFPVPQMSQDMDFSNPFRFSPLPSQGIIVLRNPSQLLPEAEYLVRMVILKIPDESLPGHLWVVDRQQIRIWPSE